MEGKKDYYTPLEVAEITKVNLKKIYYAYNNGKIFGIRLLGERGGIRLHESALDILRGEEDRDGCP
ncbi:hypothetical protein [Cetobacterium sp. SF1]|uniref:hypothetical protein n=1 Tax=Cetobacterium sp. SF1 TaxID=3417654 RepID=UPI003CF71509